MPRRGDKAEEEADSGAEDVEMSVNGESEDDDDDVYVVEAILDHKTARNGDRTYLIKWKGYPDSENTWEEEDNIIDKEILSNYWSSKEAEKPARANGRKANGRAAAAAASTVKRRRASALFDAASGSEAEAKPKAAAAAAAAAGGAPDSDNWDPRVEEITSLDRDEDGGLVVFITWKDGRSTEHPSEEVYQKCPQAMLKFYEARLRFREEPVPPE